MAVRSVLPLPKPKMDDGTHMQNYRDDLAKRLKAALGSRSHRQVSLDTGFNAETVRRWRLGGKPSPAFLAAICNTYQIAPEWLITGGGPMQSGDYSQTVLQKIPTAEILRELASRIDRSDAPDQASYVTKPEVLKLSHASHERRP